MAEGNSPKSGAGVFTKKVQRQLSRSKEKVLQRLGKTIETKDEEFDSWLQRFNDQQTDGNRIHKDLKVYLNAVRDMREASRRLSQSLFDAYETDWVGEEDLGAIVEGEDLLWNDYEVKLSDQALRTMESYMGQFPDVRERISKRGRKLIDYDSSRHHLEALQTAKKRDDIKIVKAEEELNAAKNIYEGINQELKGEFPALNESRIGCYVTVFSAISTLRDIFHKEMSTLNQDLQNVMKELQAQHPDKVFVVKGLQRYGSLKRRSLMSPKSWKTSFSDFHMSYSPRPGHQRSSFRSPDKPGHSGSLYRESSTGTVGSTPVLLESPASALGDAERESLQSDVPNSPAEELGPGEGRNGEEEERRDANLGTEPEPPQQLPLDSGAKGEKESLALSESSSEPGGASDSESLELQLSAVGDSTLYIEEKGESPVSQIPQSNGLQNGDVSCVDSGLKGVSVPQKGAPLGNQESQDPKSTDV